MAKVHSKNQQIGIILQNKTASAATAFKALGSTAKNWTNPGLAATNFREIKFNAASVIIDPDVQVDNVQLTSQSGLLEEAARSYVDYKSGLPKLSFSAPADLNFLALLVGLALQKLTTEGAVGLEDKYFEEGSAAGAIDFNAGNGILASIAVKHKGSSDDGSLMTNVLLDSLLIAMDFNARGAGRLMQVSGTFVGQKVEHEQNLSGAWVNNEVVYVEPADFGLSVLTIDSVDYSAELVKRVEFEINNNVTAANKAANGYASNYDIAPVRTVRVFLDYNAVTEKLLKDHQLGATVAVTLTNGYGADDTGYFKIAATSAKMVANPYQYDNDYAAIVVEAKIYSGLAIEINDGLVWSAF